MGKLLRQGDEDRIPHDANGSRPKGVEHGSQKGRLSWLEQKTLDEASLGYDADNQPYVVIIGGVRNFAIAAE